LARLEVEALAQGSAEQVREAIAQAVKEAAAQQSAQVQDALRAYLNQVPSAIRRSMRRPSDPSGKSVPADVGIRGAEDLVSFLPSRMPRFKSGDRPLPGVDWDLEELAGVGGFGEVWKARHPYLKSKPPVALKFCLDPAAGAALRNEAGAGSGDAARQARRHRAAVVEYEFVEGGDLVGKIGSIPGDCRCRWPSRSPKRGDGHETFSARHSYFFKGSLPRRAPKEASWKSWGDSRQFPYNRSVSAVSLICGSVRPTSTTTVMLKSSAQTQGDVLSTAEGESSYVGRPREAVLREEIPCRRYG
jgi:hypothetical protein